VGIVEKLLSLTRGLREGDVDASPSPSVDTSSLESLSGGRGAPESVAGYQLDMDSSINVRWKDDENIVECSHTGELWNTKIRDGETAVVVATHRSREDAVDAAVDVMNGRIEEARRSSDSEEEEESTGDEGSNEEEVPKSEFEQEVESILEDVDVESLEEVNEAFGD
jgi:hypothetical protein